MRPRLPEPSRLSLWVVALASAGAIIVCIPAMMRDDAARGVANAAVPALAFVVAAAGLVAGRRWHSRTLLLLVALLAPFFVLSAIMEYGRTDPFEAAIRARLAAGAKFDDRTLRRFVLDARASGRAMVPLVIPTALLEPSDGAHRPRLELDGDPVAVLSSLSHAETALGNENGTFAVVQTDRFGFNNPDGVWDLADIEVVAVGDSFTMGKCVPEPENAIARIREVIPATLNLGVAGNSPLFTLATLIEYAAPRRPGTVLWLYYPNDLAPFELGRDQATPALLRYLEPGFSAGLAARQSAIDPLLRHEVERELAMPGSDTVWTQFADARPGGSGILRRIVTLSAIRTAIASAFGGGARAWTPDLDFFERILRRAGEATTEWGGRTVFVYVPDVEEFQPHRRGYLHPAFMAKSRVLDAARAAGFEVMDLSIALAAEDDVLQLYAWTATSAAGLPHLNSEGYRVAARTILDHLIR